MIFTKSKKQCSATQPKITTQNKQIEVVSSYKYLGFLLDNKLTFKLHIEQLKKKLRLKLGFYFRNKACFSFEAKKALVSATFLPVLDYGDILYMHASCSLLRMLDTVYHGALRFITNSKSLTHHCNLYQKVGWPSLSFRRLTHWYSFIYKAILYKLPLYLCTLLTQQISSRYNLRSQDQNLILLTLPKVRTEFGRNAFSYAAPSSWNQLQKDLQLSSLITLEKFKTMVKELECRSFSVCSCF